MLRAAGRAVAPEARLGERRCGAPQLAQKRWRAVPVQHRLRHRQEAKLLSGTRPGHGDGAQIRDREGGVVAEKISCFRMPSVRDHRAIFEGAEEDLLLIAGKPVQHRLWQQAGARLPGGQNRHVAGDENDGGTRGSADGVRRASGSRSALWRTSGFMT